MDLSHLPTAGALPVGARAPRWRPGLTGVLKLGPKVIAYVGEIHPRALKAIDVEAPARWYGVRLRIEIAADSADASMTLTDTSTGTEKTVSAPGVPLAGARDELRATGARPRKLVITGVDSLGANYNVAPTDDVYGVVEGPGGRRVEVFRWGLVPSWAKDAPGRTSTQRRLWRAAGESEERNSLPLAVQCKGTRVPTGSCRRSGHSVSTRSLVARPLSLREGERSTS